jgi:hypothetical protein
MLCREWGLWRVGRGRSLRSGLLRGSYTGNSQAMDDQAGIRIFTCVSRVSRLLCWSAALGRRVEAAGVASGRSSSLLLDLEDGVSELELVRT